MKLKTVGVKDIKLPVSIREKSGSLQETVATISLHADIPKHYLGTCVSTFIAALNKHQALDTIWEIAARYGLLDF